MQQVSEPIEFSSETGVDHHGNQKRPYIALIKGPGTRFSLERSFLRNQTYNYSGTHALLPARDGVYEVRDYRSGSKRTRYYQVMGKLAAELTTAFNDDDVLAAVSSSAQGHWSGMVAVPSDNALDSVSSTSDVLEAIDLCESRLGKLIDEGDFDKEDVEMELDRIRRMVEAL